MIGLRSNISKYYLRSSLMKRIKRYLTIHEAIETSVLSDIPIENIRSKLFLTYISLYCYVYIG